MTLTHLKSRMAFNLGLSDFFLMLWFKAQALRPDPVGFSIAVATCYLCDLLKRISSPRVCFPFGKMGLMMRICLPRLVVRNK